MTSTDLSTLKQRLSDYSEARDGDLFHVNMSLSMALNIEIAEVIVNFQQLTEEKSKNPLKIN